MSTMAVMNEAVVLRSSVATAKITAEVNSTFGTAIKRIACRCCMR